MQAGNTPNQPTDPSTETPEEQSPSELQPFGIDNVPFDADDDMHVVDLDDPEALDC